MESGPSTSVSVTVFWIGTVRPKKEIFELGACDLLLKKLMLLFYDITSGI